MTQRTTTLLIVSMLACPMLARGAPRAVDRAPVRAELPSKPTGSFAIEHRLQAQPAVGVPLAIDVTARVAAGVTGLRVEADASVPRAVLVTPPALVSGGDGVYRWTITVVPLAPEAGYLNVIVSGESDGLPQAQAVTISLRSAAAPGAAPAAARAGRENLIALPVQESP